MRMNAIFSDPDRVQTYLAAMRPVGESVAHVGIGVGKAVVRVVKGASMLVEASDPVLALNDIVHGRAPGFVLIYYETGRAGVTQYGQFRESGDDPLNSAIMTFGTGIGSMVGAQDIWDVAVNEDRHSNYEVMAWSERCERAGSGFFDAVLVIAPAAGLASRPARAAQVVATSGEASRLALRAPGAVAPVGLATRTSAVFARIRSSYQQVLGVVFDGAKPGDYFLGSGLSPGRIPGARITADAVRGTAPQQMNLWDDLGARLYGDTGFYYESSTHVYRIKSPDGTTYKIGESGQGVRMRDGASIRAEQQVRDLNRRLGPGHSSEIGLWFRTKEAARKYETRLIERFRRMYGEDALPGNVTNR